MLLLFTLLLFRVFISLDRGPHGSTGEGEKTPF
jgi:hypothetical protein